MTDFDPTKHTIALNVAQGRVDICCDCANGSTCDECATQFYNSGPPTMSLANTITTRHDPPPFSTAYYVPAPAQMSITATDLTTALNAMPDSIKSYTNNGGADDGVMWSYPRLTYQTSQVWSGAVAGDMTTYPEIYIPNSYIEIEKLRTTTGSRGFQGNLWGVKSLSIRCVESHTIETVLTLRRWVRGVMDATGDNGIYTPSEGGSPILGRYTLDNVNETFICSLTFTSSYAAPGGIWNEDESCSLAFPQTSSDGVFNTAGVDQMIANSTITWG